MSGWKKWYSNILKEFKYDEKKDKESAIILNSILKRSTINNEILNLIKNKTVFVIGSGPSLSTAIPKLKNLKKSIKIAADSSVKPLVDNGIIPDIVITDLDEMKIHLKRLQLNQYLLYMHMETT